MIQPNADAILFCDWLINVSWQSLTAPQLAVVQNVQSAAISQTLITNNDWSNFNKFTAWRYPSYLVYKDLASVIYPTLLTDLMISLNLDGNLTDSAGFYTPSSSNITYPVGSGKIGLGAQFNGANSQILFGTIPIGINKTIGVWVRMLPGGANPQLIWGRIGSTIGLYYLPSTGQLNYTYPGNYFSDGYIAVNQYACVIVDLTPSSVDLYIDNVLIHSTGTPQPADSIAGAGLENGFFAASMDMDIFNVWDRNLSPAERHQFYNAGAGIQYPF